MQKKPLTYSPKEFHPSSSNLECFLSMSETPSEKKGVVYKLQKKTSSNTNYRSRGVQSPHNKIQRQDSRGYGKNSNDQKDEERVRVSKKNSGDFKALLNELEKEMSKIGMMGIGFPVEPTEIKVVH